MERDAPRAAAGHGKCGPVREKDPRCVDLTRLRGRIDVFADRAEAGRVLAEMLREIPGLQSSDARLLAIPAGGVPVAAALAGAMQWPLDVAVVSKITLPWNTEAGYGAVAFDGSVEINDDLVRATGLSGADVATGIAVTQAKVRRRLARLRRGREPLQLAGCCAVLVDDGLATGFTMRAAAAACRTAGASRVVVVVPTGHAGAIERLLQPRDESAHDPVDLIVCANVREGAQFAVADAYVRWQDVPEAQAELVLEEHARTSRT